MAILRLMLSYGTLPKLRGKKKIDPGVVVTITVDDIPVERSNGLQCQKIRLLCSKRNPAVVAADDDDVPVKEAKVRIYFRIKI